MREDNGHETERANQGNGGGGLYFAVAPGDSDSGFTFVFSAAWLHLEVRGAKQGRAAWQEIGQGAVISSQAFCWASWGAQAASLLISAACRDASSSRVR